MVNILHTVHTYSARWFMMAFSDATVCILRFLLPMLHVMQRKTAIRSHVHCNINNLYHKYKNYMYM